MTPSSGPAAAFSSAADSEVAGEHDRHVALLQGLGDRRQAQAVAVALAIVMRQHQPGDAVLARQIGQRGDRPLDQQLQPIHAIAVAVLHQPRMQVEAEHPLSRCASFADPRIHSLDVL